MFVVFDNVFGIIIVKNDKNRTNFLMLYIDGLQKVCYNFPMMPKCIKFKKKGKSLCADFYL